MVQQGIVSCDDAQTPESPSVPLHQSRSKGCRPDVCFLRSSKERDAPLVALGIGFQVHDCEKLWKQSEAWSIFLSHIPYMSFSSVCFCGGWYINRLQAQLLLEQNTHS